MIKPETNIQVNGILIDPYNRTVNPVILKGLAHAYELLDTDNITSIPSPWQSSGEGFETMFVKTDLQRNNIPFGRTKMFGFHHSLIDIRSNFPVVGKAIIVKTQPNGQDMDTELSLEVVRSTIQFYEWEQKYTTN